MLHPLRPQVYWPTRRDGTKPQEPGYYYTCDKDKGVLEVELPGVSKEDIMIEVHGHQLMISAKRYKDTKETSEASREYELGLRLGHDADVDGVAARTFTDGLLVLHVPTLKGAGPSRVEIGAA